MNQELLKSQYESIVLAVDAKNNAIKIIIKHMQILKKLN